MHSRSERSSGKDPVVERVCKEGGKGVLPCPSEGVFSEAITEADR